MIADKKDRAVMGGRHEENPGEPQRHGGDKSMLDKITNLRRFHRSNETNKSRPAVLQYPREGFKLSFECKICRNELKRNFGDMARHVRDQHKSLKMNIRK